MLRNLRIAALLMLGAALAGPSRAGGVEPCQYASVFANAVVSYEPIWAIGTGLAASAEQAQSMHEFIRGKVAALDASAAASLKILYGGSVNPQNAVQLLAMQDIDGGLIGKCSLIAQEFEKICLAAA